MKRMDALTIFTGGFRQVQQHCDKDAVIRILGQIQLPAQHFLFPLHPRF